MSAALEALLDELADAVADRVVERLRTGDRPGWVDQTASPLGRKKHCAAVRRRVAAAQGGAAVIGRRHLLSHEALAEELEGGSKRKPRQGRASDALAAELGLEVLSGGRR